MKKICLILCSVSVLLTVGCSSSDDNNTGDGSSSMKSEIVGKWKSSQSTDSNIYEYKSNGSAVYTNYYHGEKDVYNGKWKLLEGNVMIEAYAEPGEGLLKDWEEYPDMTKVIISVDENVMKFRTTNSDYVDQYYRVK